MKDFHYKRDAIGGGISVCFALFVDGKLTGGSVLGLPRHSKKYPDSIDIRRMACTDDSPKNSESYFIGRIRRWLRDNTEYKGILSYSDLTKGHNGTIYKASGFTVIGNTALSKIVEWNGREYHPRSLSIDRPYSYKLREAVKSGEATVITGKSKIIWYLEIKRK